MTNETDLLATADGEGQVVQRGEPLDGGAVVDVLGQVEDDVFEAVVAAFDGEAHRQVVEFNDGLLRHGGSLHHLGEARLQASEEPAAKEKDGQAERHQYHETFGVEPGLPENVSPRHQNPPHGVDFIDPKVTLRHIGDGDEDWGDEEPGHHDHPHDSFQVPEVEVGGRVKIADAEGQQCQAAEGQHEVRYNRCPAWHDAVEVHDRD